jgi:hypothetical protein
MQRDDFNEAPPRKLSRLSPIPIPNDEVPFDDSRAMRSDVHLNEALEINELEVRRIIFQP